MSYWFISNNPSQYDIRAALANSNELYYKERSNDSITVGDTVFLYSSAPESRITHKFEVIRTGLTFPKIEIERVWFGNDEFFKRWRNSLTFMKLRLLAIAQEDDTTLSYPQLIRYGMKQVYVTQRISGDALTYILSQAKAMLTPSPFPGRKLVKIENNGVEGKDSEDTEDLLELAASIALRAHAGQKDKSGRPYFLHPFRIAMKCLTDDEIMVALLHDVIEDSDFDAVRLRAEGIPENVVEAVETITRKEGESYENFIMRIKDNSLARRVKLIDLEDNLNIMRLDVLSAEDTARCNKYLAAHNYLLSE